MYALLFMILLENKTLANVDFLQFCKNDKTTQTCTNGRLNNIIRHDMESRSKRFGKKVHHIKSKTEFRRKTENMKQKSKMSK